MNKNLQSPTKLTEFAPLQPEEKQQGVGQFITKFFKLAKTPVSGEQTPVDNADNLSQESLPNWAIDTLESSSSTKDSVYPVDITEGRSLPNVLKRISNLLALKSTNLQDYASTEMKQYWMPDSVSKECYECCEKFTTFRRRHHCRVCGQIFCSQCCNEQIPGKIFGCTGDLRVCTYCCKVVLSYLQSSDVGADLSADLRVLQESLMNKYGVATVSPSAYTNTLSTSMSTLDSLDVNNTIKRKISVGYQEEKFASGSSLSTPYLTSEEKCKALQNSTSLRNLYEEICRPNTGVQLKSHRYRLRTYNDCFQGSDLVDWLIYQQKASTRVQAAAICQALLEGGYLEYLSDPCHFIDGYSLYKLGTLSSPEQIQTFEMPHHDEPSWVQQINQESSATDSDNEQANKSHGHMTSSSSYMLDLNIEASTVYLSRPAVPNSPDSDDGTEQYKSACVETPVVRTSEQRELVPESGWHDATVLREENGERMAYTILTEAYKQQEQSLLKQMLNMNGLAFSWSDILTPLIHEIVNVIRPDKNHDAVELDIRHYVQFKKVPKALKSDTYLCRGIICSKNIAHKGMATYIENPKILLLQCSIVYQRTEGRLMSLDPVLMQEHEYLRHVAARIAALQPDIVMVQRNVSRLAQDLLRQQGVTLVHNVKQTILERLSRCTDADLVSNVDAHIGRPKLGTCQKFYLKKYDTEGGPKTLMFFEGLPQQHLGGTVILRGASKNELVKVKKVVLFYLFAHYNWRLEKSFLMDEYALPPRDDIFDDSKENSPLLPPANKISEPTKQVPTTDTVNTLKDKQNVAVNEEKVIPKEPVEAFSDPLRDLENGVYKSSGKEKLSVAELPFSNEFRKALNGTILSVSPYIAFSMPYLETDVGKKCKLRSFFPEEIFYSKQFSHDKKIKYPTEVDVCDSDTNLGEETLSPPHPFITTKLTTSTENNQVQGMLASFRACGGRYKKKRVLVLPTKEEEAKNRKNSVVGSDRFEVFDPMNHQKLAVLFCSFSPESNNAPAFCVNPWVVHMDFYGCNDIPLGCFLERYCFRSTYACPSKNCETPMLNHIRRFVHNTGCVSISLRSFADEFLDKNIVTWSWCTKCQNVSPVVPMSSDTWSYSFAKFLELMFYGNVYGRRGKTPCNHSLHHDMYHYFGYRSYVASFMYSTVQLWEISLPPPIISIDYNATALHNELINEIKTLALKGHDVYSIVFEKLHCLPSDLEGVANFKQILSKEQAFFKQKIEEVQLQLTSPSLENKDFEEDHKVHTSLWKIQDGLVRIKKIIVDTVDQWNSRLSDVVRKSDKKKDKPQVDSDGPRTPEILEADYSLMQNNEGPNSGSPAITKKIRSLDQSDGEDETASPKCHQRSQSDGTVISTNEESTDSKRDVDKKTVKNILSQLLPSSTNLAQVTSPFSPQEHYIFTNTNFPLIAYENEPISIVAHALNSFEYKRSYDEFLGKQNQNSDTPSSPVCKKKGQENNSEITSSLEKSAGLLSFLRNKEGKLENATSSQSTGPHEGQSQDTPEKSDDNKKCKTAHIEVQFQDSNCNFFCRVYYAERFAWLRGLVVPDGEEAYIRSLSRSVRWNARGGKSGSNFAKSTDDRFILKDMSKTEVQLFMDWAPNYFTYMERCCATSQPTLLGKILGIYTVIFKNNVTNVTSRTNLLVMENLFYKKTVVQKFDLKGSVRNRMANPNSETGEIVLLDENLLKMTCESPLYILPHSKSVLTAAIQYDTEFLSAQSVMDYSLLVGLDEENKELVLGIIDYIRTFTWDKKLETIVKRYGILGGQGKLPTIVSPEEYQKRFIEAMHRYFLEVPDHWAGLGKGIEC